jgi:DNA invertase Pin-like site-specific DNA recombinase
VLDDPSIDTSAHRKNILALTAEIESDIRRERQMDGIVKAQDGDVRSGREPGLVS